MESLVIIRYKWQQGVYTLRQMMKMVQDGDITKDQFFSITRFHYDGIKFTRLNEQLS